MEKEIIDLYQDFLKAWNNRSAIGMSELCATEATMIGFDGTQMNGRTVIQAELERIFAAHPNTHQFISIVKEVRWLGEGVLMLSAVSSLYQLRQQAIMVPTNAVQSLIAIREDGAWKIALFQNTPAQFHDNPDAAAELTSELQAALDQKLSKDQAD